MALNTLYRALAFYQAMWTLPSPCHRCCKQCSSFWPSKETTGQSNGWNKWKTWKWKVHFRNIIYLFLKFQFTSSGHRQATLCSENQILTQNVTLRTLSKVKVLVNCVHRHSVVKKLHTSPSENIVKNSQNFEVSLNCFLVFTFIPPLHNWSLSLFIIFPEPAKYFAEPPNLPETVTLRDPGRNYPECHRSQLTSETRRRHCYRDHYSGYGP